MNKLSIGDIVSINIDDYKNYIEESAKKDGKVEKPIKRIHNFLDWYLHKNISDILSNQMFHECYYIYERLQFSPDMKKLAYATFDHSIRIDIMNLEGKYEQNDLVFKYHTQKIQKIDFSNDGTKLVTLGQEKILIFWNINEQTFLFKLKPENANFSSLRFSKTDKYFAAGTDDSLLMVWTLLDNCRKSSLKHLFQDHKKAVTSLDFSSDEVLLISGSEDKSIMMHHVETGELMHTFKEHFDSVTSLRFSPRDNTFVSGGRDKKVILWNADQKCKIKNFKNRPEEVIHLRYSTDGSLIYTVDKDCKIYVFDCNGDVRLGPLKEHDKTIETLGFMRENDEREILVTASRDKCIVKWDTYSGKIIKKPLSKYPMRPNNSYAIITPDSQRIITMTNPAPHYNNTLITRWKAASGIPDDKMEYQGIIFGQMTYSNNSECFAAATRDRRIFIWKTSNIKMPIYVVDQAFDSDITSLAFYVDKSTEIIAAGSSDRKLGLWDAAKNKQISDCKDAHENSISIIRFSPDGTRMATYSSDILNSIAIWNPAQGQKLFVLMDHGKTEITCIKFSHDSAKMAIGNKTGEIFIYGVSMGINAKWKIIPLSLDLINGPVSSIAFSKYNSKLATASKVGKNNEINVWDISNGSLQIGPLIGHHYDVSSMSFSREDSVLTSFSKDSLKSWRFFNKSTEKAYSVDGNDIYDVSTDGSKILGRGEKNEILIYNSTDFSAEFNKLEVSSKDLKFLNFSSDGVYCLGGDTVTLTIWVARTGEVKQKIKDMVKSFVCGIFSKKADLIVTGSFSGTITLWSLNQGTEIFTFKEKHKGEVILLGFSPDDNYIASGDIKNKIYVWSIEKRTKIFEMLEHEARLISLEISYDSSSICSISEDRNIKFWSFLNTENKMRELEKAVTKNKKIFMMKFNHDWNMYCIILENRKKIEFYDTREKVPMKILEFQSPILKVFWSKNNDVFIVFNQELRCFMNFLNRELMFLEKGLKICEFFRDPEKFSPSEIQRIVNGSEGKVIPFSYTFLQIVAYTNDYKGFFANRLHTIMKNNKIKIHSHAFFDKDIHGNSCIDIILKKKEKNILKMIFKYIIKNYTVRELFKEDYNVNMTLLYKILKIFGQDTYILDKLLKMAFDSPERFPETFNYKELPEPLYLVRNQPQLTKTEIKPMLSDHIKEHISKGYTPSKFKTKIQVKCVYISDILDENNQDTLLFFKNICKLSATNKLFENEVLAKVISYKWESDGYKDFFSDGLLNLAFLFLYLINALLIFPYRSDSYSENYDIYCYISLFCDIILYCFLLYQGYQEAQQCYKLSLKHYISSIWNVNDVTRIVSGFISSSMDVISIYETSLYSYCKACHAITIFVCFIKIISFARGIKNSAFIVRLVIQVFLDIRAFLLIVFIFILSLGFSVFMIQSDFEYSPLESFNIFFRNMLGDFTDFDNLSVMNTPMLYVFFMVGSLLVTIILLNLLIAIICDTYKKVSKNENYTRIYEMCSILYETDTREVKKSEKEDDSQYLFYISNHTDVKDKDKEKWYYRIKRKLKEKNFMILDRLSAMEQKIDGTGVKERRMTTYIDDDE